MRFLPVANPPNPFSSTTLDYELGEVPHAPVQVFEDHTRSILARNDSPDVGFEWSVNPYRGCLHACAYCLAPDTPVLMADASVRRIEELHVGDAIYGTRDGRYFRTRILAKWETKKRAHRVTLADGTTLVMSADHRMLTTRGWAKIAGDLAVGDTLLGTGAFVASAAKNLAYMRGYVAGLVRCETIVRVDGLDLVLLELDALRRTRDYLVALDQGIRLVANDRPPTQLVRAVEWPDEESFEWAAGFLAAVFDADGRFAEGALSLRTGSAELAERVLSALRRIGLRGTVDRDQDHGLVVHLRGALPQQLRFLHVVDPAVRRRCELDGIAVPTGAELQIVAIEDLGVETRMIDVTTGSEDFLANGVVSHNCYARPSHEYLSFGAGTDFSTKIVVKPKAAELLREAFDKKSWKGDLVVFSGITDCYQPLEHSLKLTRGCLEVCIEYRNPAGFITKSPVIERDAELLAELARVAQCRVSISIPFWDPEVARAIEPTVTTPARRMKIVETLAKAGVPVGVSVSPIVPGLNDQTIPDVLQAAKDAGASHAFFVMLRLPGSVAPVFETALREKLPLRAEKVLRRLREMHGNKLYDSRFGHRGRGEGVYAGTIQTLFTQTAKRLGLVADENKMYDPPTAGTFRRPHKNGQMGFEF